jgi:hypothetical protein
MGYSPNLATLPTRYNVRLLEKCVESSGPNPTTASYNASVVKIYKATSSLVRFENNNTYFLQF